MLQDLIKQSLTAKGRKRLYASAIALTSLLVIYKVLDSEQAIAWSTLIAALLGIVPSSVALGHINPDPEDVEDADDAELA